MGLEESKHVYYIVVLRLAAATGILRESTHDAKGLKREFYHNCTNSVLQQQEETFGKLQIALFRISSLTKVN